MQVKRVWNKYLRVLLLRAKQLKNFGKISNSSLILAKNVRLLIFWSEEDIKYFQHFYDQNIYCQKVPAPLLSESNDRPLTSPYSRC